MANQTVPTCCKLGDEKMAWLWWVVDLSAGYALCMAQSDRTEANERVCWRPAGHPDEHEWQRPYPRSVFDLMTELELG